MSKMSKTIDTNLICITGKPGSGKSTAIGILKNAGYQTFVTDQWVHEFYKKPNRGFDLIAEAFGTEYVTHDEVNRKKLLRLILDSYEQKNKLDNLMFKEIYKHIYGLSLLNQPIFVELGIFLSRPEFFRNLFKAVIVIENDRISYEKNNINNFYKDIKFSTKPVGNSKSTEKSTTIFVDYVVENFKDLGDFENNLKIFLEVFYSKI